MRKSRKIGLWIGAATLVVAAASWGFSTLNGASEGIDPSKIATVEAGTMTRSVVATGKVEPITKVEIKSKANGIIERLLVDVDLVVQPGHPSGRPGKLIQEGDQTRGDRAPADALIVRARRSTGSSTLEGAYR